MITMKKNKKNDLFSIHTVFSLHMKKYTIVKVHGNEKGIMFTDIVMDKPVVFYLILLINHFIQSHIHNSASLLKHHKHPLGKFQIQTELC